MKHPQSNNNNRSRAKEPIANILKIVKEIFSKIGNGQVKLFPDVLDQTDMKGDTEYSIMSGPDIYGPRTKKGHVIFNYKCKNVLINKDIHCKDDEFIHLTHSLCGLITPMRWRLTAVRWNQAPWRMIGTFCHPRR